MLGAPRGFQELGEAGGGRVLSVRPGAAMGKPRAEAAVWGGHSLPGTCWPRKRPLRVPADHTAPPHCRSAGQVLLSTCISCL